ncbi:MAG: efflux RND transporter periplasmic adaptor subunit [bacterium]|nr:efflux RND transporter periplasmic adaptor subunit [bacterium]
MHSRARIVIPILLVVVAIGVYLGVFSHKKNPNRLVISGNIEIIDSQLSFRIPGMVTDRYVDEGDSVTNGQPIASLDKTNQELLVAQAEANVGYVTAILAELQAGTRPEDIQRAAAQVEQARARLAEVTSGSREQEIADAESTLDRARAGAEAAKSQLDLAQSDYDRFSQLYDEGVITRRDFEESETRLEVAQTTLTQAEAGVSSAEDYLSLRIEGARPEQIDQARAGLNIAQAGYDLALAGPRPETIEQAQAQLNVANESLRQAQQQLEYTELYAPFDGVVLSKSVEPGEYVNPGSTVVAIGQLDKVWLRAYIIETDLARVSLGQEVKVTTDTYPDRVYSGTISYISDQAEFTPKAVQTPEERVNLMYMIKIELENPNHDLKPGMPADCVIDFGQQ